MGRAGTICQQYLAQTLSRLVSFINMQFTRSLFTEQFHHLTILNPPERSLGEKETHMAVSFLLPGHVGTLAYSARWKIKNSHMSHL